MMLDLLQLPTGSPAVHLARVILFGASQSEIDLAKVMDTLLCPWNVLVSAFCLLMTTVPFLVTTVPFLVTAVTPL